jgi:hypothetical protein
VQLYNKEERENQRQTKYTKRKVGIFGYKYSHCKKYYLKSGVIMEK